MVVKTHLAVNTLLFTLTTWSKMDHNCVVMDVQCFKNNFNEFIIKEVVAIDLQSKCLLFHHIVKPPFNRNRLTREKMREVNWLTHNHHGLGWDDGDVDYHTILEIIKNNLTTTSTVLVKGCEKRHFIQTIVPDWCSVIDVEPLGCGSLKFLNTDDTLRCNNHKCTNNVCALSNSFNIRKWFMYHTCKENKNNEFY